MKIKISRKVSKSYRLFYAAILLFWILDICNMSFMEPFDTTYPFNTLFWFLVWFFIPGTSIDINGSDGKQE